MFKFEVELRYNGHALTVGGVAEPYSPARGPSWNSPGEPAEGGSVEITKVELNRGTRTRALSKAHVEQLNYDDIFCEAVSDAVIDYRR